MYTEEREATPAHTTPGEIVDALDGARSALLDTSRDLTQAQLDSRPDPERWSIGENLDHLARVERGVASLLRKKLDEARAAGEPVAAPPQIATLDRFQIATNPRKVKAPDRVAPEHGVARDELLARLERGRAELRDAYDALADYDLTAHTFPHPALGEINLYQWVIFVAQHERRHLNQINSVLADPNFPRTTIQSGAA